MDPLSVTLSPRVKEILEGYTMFDLASTEGLREHLASGFVYPGHNAVARQAVPPRAKDPVTGEWSEL